MLLYLTTNEKCNLLNNPTKENNIYTKKMIGNFSFKSFVNRDMRSYAASEFLCVDRNALTDGDEEIIEAIGAFNLMYQARIIFICDGLSVMDPFYQSLSNAGVVNIVNATDIETIFEQINICLSAEGMISKIKDISPLKEIITYKFNNENIKISIIGSNVRTGVTVTTTNLASYLTSVGAKVCVVPIHKIGDYENIANFENIKITNNTFEMNNIGFSLDGNAVGEYDFIIYDCGNVYVGNPKEFASSDIKIICGGTQVFEIADFMDTAKFFSDYGNVYYLANFWNDEQVAPAKEVLGERLIFSERSNELWDSSINNEFYYNLIQDFISETETKL